MKGYRIFQKDRWGTIVQDGHAAETLSRLEEMMGQDNYNEWFGPDATDDAEDELRHQSESGTHLPSDADQDIWVEAIELPEPNYKPLAILHLEDGNGAYISLETLPGVAYRKAALFYRGAGMLPLLQKCVDEDETADDGQGFVDRWTPKQIVQAMGDYDPAGRDVWANIDMYMVAQDPNTGSLYIKEPTQEECEAFFGSVN